MEKIVLVGGGGHAKVVIDAIRKSGDFDIYGIVDPSLDAGERVLGIKVIGKDSVLPRLFKEGVKNAFIGVGSIGDCGIRKRIYGQLEKIGFELPVIVHQRATIAEDVTIGEGTFVAAGAVINAGTILGRNAIINTSSSVDHDCVIGDFVHIAPGATLSGGIRVGDETHIGTGAKIIQSLNIGRNCLIGAGVTVRHNLRNGEKHYGGFEAGNIKKNKRVFIIAEAGVNHNGDIRLAKRLVNEAKKCGADAIKFQTFKTECLVTNNAPKAAYQKKGLGRRESHFDMIKKLELDKKSHRELLRHCRKRKIIFLSSSFDIASAIFLNRLGMEIYKIPSGEIDNLPYLRAIGRFGKKVLLSTGMADLDDIDKALCAIVESGTPKSKISVLHCHTEYPTPFENVNLRAMLTIRDAFNVDVGYSDHTVGIEAAISAVALGASVIEKHFTLDKRMKGPDHRSSLEPDELKSMIRSIRNIEVARGNGVKAPSYLEMKNRLVIRKSIVASRSIREGEELTEGNITTKRPATGMSPMLWDKVIGTRAAKDYDKDEIIVL